jgi:hypothetical protein
MGGSQSTLGLLFEIQADPANAEAAMARFGAQSAALTETINAGAAKTAATMDAVAVPAVARTANEIRQAQAAAIIFEQQMGVHVPRGINTMLARAELIGPLFQGAFAIGIFVIFAEQIGRVAKAISSAALELGGFSKDMQEVFKQEVEFNAWLISHSKERLESEVKLNVIGRGKINDAIASTRAELARLEAEGTKTGIMYKGMDVGATGHRAVVSGLHVQLAGLEKQLEANQLAGEKMNLELAKLQQTHKGATGTVKEHKQALGEEDTEIERTNRLFRELNVAVLTSDTAYREYLHTLGDINRIYDEHSRQVLAELNDERFRQALAKEANKLLKDEAALTLEMQKSLKLENVEIQHLYGSWAQALGQYLKVHASTIEFIRDMNLAGISTKQLREEVARTFVLGLPSSLNISRKALAQWANDVKLHVGIAQAAFVALKDTVREMEAGMSEALGQSIAAAIVYKQSIGAAMAAAVKAEASAIAGRALVKGIWETAEGFAALARAIFGDPQAGAEAAMHFEAAALYAAVGGVAAGIGRAIPGGTTAGAAGGAPAYSPAGAGAAGTAAAAPQPMTYVKIDLGNTQFFSREVVNALIDEINNAAKNGGKIVISSYSLQPSPVRI